MSFPFRNLVFEGGGVKGIAYVGALQVLEATGVLGEIERVGATSAGAINAVLLALNYSLDETRRGLEELDFNNFPGAGPGCPILGLVDVICFIGLDQKDRLKRLSADISIWVLHSAPPILGRMTTQPRMGAYSPFRDEVTIWSRGQAHSEDRRQAEGRLRTDRDIDSNQSIIRIEHETGTGNPNVASSGRSTDGRGT